jgi:Predicted membrane protein (DUF2127)
MTQPSRGAYNHNKMTQPIRAATVPPRIPGRAIVLLIAFFKFGKGCLMILSAATALALTDPRLHDQSEQWIVSQSLGPYRRRVGEFILTNVFGRPANTYRAVAIGLGAYAVLFFTEGLGLFFDRTWAEWMVVFTSAGLIPFELIEIYHHPRPLTISIYLLNVAIVVYLFHHVRERIARLHAGQISPSGTPLAPPHPDAGSCAPGTSTPHSEASASVHP